MSIPKIASSITNSKTFKAIGTKVNDVCNTIGRKVSPALEKHPKLDEFIKGIEPTGANNSFPVLTTLMIGMVICPRVITAAKRNPDNKEATKDEIKEILFRDVQTVAIILFLLKILNSLIAGKVSKMGGLPMTNKPYTSVFDSNTKGLQGIVDKAKEIIANPSEKLKKIGRNFLDTIHPTGGVRALTNDEFVSRYSNVNNIKDIQKIFKEIDDKKGNPEKIFDKVIKILVEKQEGIVADAKGTGAVDLASKERVLEKFKELQKTGYSALSDSNIDKLDKDLETRLVIFFNDENNALVHDAKKLNAALRTGALAIESTYLGLGLPALNQRRLEKKYLENKKDTPKELVNPMANNGFNPLLGKTMKAQEIGVYKKFVK